MKRLPALLTGMLLAGTQLPAQTQSPYLDFKGKHLLVLSDADMLALAYVTGDAGPKTKDLQDALTLISLGNDLAKHPPVTLPVSNSVKAWPNNLALSPDGRYALVTELYGPAPEGNPAIGATPDGHLLTLVDLQDPGKPRVTDKIRIGAKTGAIDVRPQGDLVAVATGEKGRELALLPFRNGKLEKPNYVTVSGPGKHDPAISHLSWHPSGQYLVLTDRGGELVQFYRYDPRKTSLKPGEARYVPAKCPA
jgi:hypothetical protein